MHGTVQASTAEAQQQLALQVPRQRVASRDLFTIGQLWRRRRDRSMWRVFQVHRADRLVVFERGCDECPAGTCECAISRPVDRTPVPFTEARRRYALIGRAVR